ncbi:MAG TPA: hypothetical protein VF989_21375 [Polyangiaceae bacterium]|jgi:hypothetical protein
MVSPRLVFLLGALLVFLAGCTSSCIPHAAAGAGSEGLALQVTELGHRQRAEQLALGPALDFPEAAVCAARSPVEAGAAPRDNSGFTVGTAFVSGLHLASFAAVRPAGAAPATPPSRPLSDTNRARAPPRG